MCNALCNNITFAVITSDINNSALHHKLVSNTDITSGNCNGCIVLQPFTAHRAEFIL